MRRLGLVVLASLLTAPAALAAANLPPSGFVTVGGRTIHTGVEYATISRTGPLSAVAHVAHIAPHAAVDLRVVNAGDLVSNGAGNQELTSDMCARSGCLAGINAGWWDAGISPAPLGGVVSQGRLLRSSGTDPQVTLLGDGRFIAGALEWQGQAVGSDGTPLTITAVNRAVTDGIALMTPEWGDSGTAGEGAELVLQSPEPLGTFDRSVTVQVGELRDQGGEIPAGGALLVGTGAGEDTLRQLGNGLSAVGGTITVTLSSPVDARESIGAHLVVLRDGQKVIPPEGDPIAFTRMRRSLLGWNDAGDVFMVAVDAQTGDSQGMSLSDASTLLLNLGATDGVDFDSDATTALAVEGVLANRPKTGDVEHPALAAFVALPGIGGPRVGPFVPVPAPTPVPEPEPEPPAPSGYWMVGDGGDVYAFGDAAWLGNAAVSGGARAVDLEPTPTSQGYWVVDDQGHVFAFGDAPHRGNADPARLAPGEKVTSLSGSGSGEGYWIFTDRGRVVPQGDADHHGDLADVKLNGPVLDSIPTATGLGYYMVASDGGIFTFGDARFYGALGDIMLNAPVQSLVPYLGAPGYWLVASDGGVFSFGDAPFRGSLGSTELNQPVTGMVPFGDGYLMVGEDGGIFNFSDLPFAGSLGSTPPARPVVSVAALR
ncbi:MAG: phosphodiester glycosidase family protein [Acidimicrobiia bacterium]